MDRSLELSLSGTDAPGYDVVVIGEALIELSSDAPLTEAEHYRRSFSGDALNAAAAAAASGARTALLTRVSDDEFGTALCDYASALGIDVSQVLRTRASNGIYFTALDPLGERHFVYHRRGSAASTMQPGDLDEDLLGRSSVLLLSGVGCAISPSGEATSYHAAKIVRAAGGRVVYDPNFRRPLVEPAEARRHLRELSGLADVVTPSCPDDSLPLLGSDDPEGAARACRDHGARVGIATLGSRGVLVDDGLRAVAIPAAPAHTAVDATGCGDAFAGALAAGLAGGATAEEAARRGVALAARCVTGRGGTGYLHTGVTAPDDQRHDSTLRGQP